jgi:hypothetical protein
MRVLPGGEGEALGPIIVASAQRDERIWTWSAEDTCWRALVVGLLLGAASPGITDWAQWRGPNRDAGRQRSRLGPMAGRACIGSGALRSAAGQSSPVVAGNSVFMFSAARETWRSRTPSTCAAGGRCGVRAIRRPTSFTPEPLHSAGDQGRRRSSPTVDSSPSDQRDPYGIRRLQRAFSSGQKNFAGTIPRRRAALRHVDVPADGRRAADRARRGPRRRGSHRGRSGDRQRKVVLSPARARATRRRS